MRVGWRVIVSTLAVVGVGGAAYAVGLINDVAVIDRNFVIDAFDQDVVITADGDTRVTERIDVTFTTPRRGIFRDFDAQIPFRSSGAYTDIDVRRPGADEPWRYAIEEGPKGPRVRIGDAGTFLAPGSYPYLISYRAPSWYYQLRGDPDRAEVRIDAPGFDWPTSIATSTLRVRVPGPVLDAVCVEGPRRATQPCANPPQIDGDQVTFTFGPFADRESGTVSVFLPSDAFDVPLPTVRATPLDADGLFGPLPFDRATSALLLALLIGLPVAAWEWLSARALYRDHVTDPALHDRQHPTALPAPPHGFRPPEVAGLLLEQDADRLFLATLVDLDQRGSITTTTQVVSGKWLKKDTESLTVGPRTSSGALPPEDSAIIAALIPAGSTTTFDGTYDSTVAGRVSAVSSELTNRASAVFEVHGLVHRAGGLIAQPWFRLVVPAAYAVVAGLFAVVVARITPLNDEAAIAVVALVVGGWLLARAPWRHHRLPLNSEGRDAIAQARSFHEFVRTVEGEQLEYAAGQPGIDHHHPAVSLLPYAIALGLADSWYDRFGGVMRELAAVGAAGAAAAGGAWWMSQRSFSNVSASQAGTSTAPSSSGGGGSGGGSGGGGGGGGSW